MQVIISGMFRSGTTHLWKLLSANRQFDSSYCEPLHPRLGKEMLVWDHYRNYCQRSELIEKYWSPRFSSKKLSLSPLDHFPELAEYLTQLLDSNSISKFTRLTLRLGWIAKLFPNAFIVNIVRDPRAVCFSMLHHPDSKDIVRQDLSWEDWHAREYYALYSQMDPFREYLVSVKDAPPYIKILALWRINVEQSLSDTKDYVNQGVVVRHEDLCVQPEKELRRIYEKMGTQLPPEVFRVITSPMGNTRPWQQPTTSAWMNLYKRVDSSIWQEGIQRAEIGPSMEGLGYEI